MNVVLVCTGNVARSPALAVLLGAARPDLHVDSAAVGVRAVAGRRMARPMRELLAAAGHAGAAAAHRSQLLAQVPAPDVLVATAPVHVARLAVLAPGRDVILVGPIPDPAFGGPAAYGRVWPRILAAVDWLAATLPHEHGDTT